MVIKEMPLKAKITRLLEIELSDSGRVTCPNENITFIMTSQTSDRDFGRILQQIHRVIDEYYPERDEHIFILIRNDSGTFQNMVKIWKSN